MAKTVGFHIKKKRSLHKALKFRLSLIYSLPISRISLNRLKPCPEPSLLHVLQGSKTMDFKHEDPVEICKKGEGFSGIYYNATFLAAIGRNRYLVRYDTRFNEDGYRKLVEAVDSDEIRPLPPKTAYTKFVVSDRVEAYVNLAWRVGTVTRKVDPNYYVKLDCNGREEHCAFYKVRLHLEWRNGRWSYPGSGYVALFSVVCLTSCQVLWVLVLLISRFFVKHLPGTDIKNISFLHLLS